MAGTDGDWLPGVARERLARYRERGLKTSLLPVAGAVGVESVGLRPVGEVMGCIVQNIGWTGGLGYGMGGFAGSVSFQPYVDALYHGYDAALARMTTEAKGMNADGIVAVRLTRGRLGENGQEFLALGTAVRADSAHRPKSLFTTDLPGQDVAKLMQAGWVPARIAIGIAVESQFLDWQSRAQMSVMAGNSEVDAYTQLITRTRARSRQSFAGHARDSGGDGAIVASMSLRSWHQDAGNTPLLCAEATVFGTTISRFHRDHKARTKALTIMPLRDPR
ncbi:heavy metal-binding domain-containing protein [Amycolatopsis alkalitolerans]|uniref:YbjQ family protein n=1 Tax=Amycolatopsis alkalitolerans TaxID=2547244 RepID=A0A5C4M8H0_9PSEU|nr:heavy metal-binding domain-containing protein [Amycolatopsis alkalitolerans]TNC29143.1 YbjQ family protein [Amycolatopsis alkalitolerans]